MFSQKPSSDLGRIARRFVRSTVEYDDVHAWAITGSVARMNASQSSDLELWALVSRSRRSQSLVFEDVPITIFFESEAMLFDPTYLLLVEAEDMEILVDVDGTLAEVKALAKSLFPKFIRFAKQQAQKELSRIWHTIAATPQDSFAHLLARRDEATLLLSLAGLKIGQRRLLKARELKHFFDLECVEQIYKALALDDAHGLGLETLYRENWDRLSNLLAKKQGQGFGRSLKHTSLMRKAKAGEWGDSVLAARSLLRRYFLANVPNKSAYYEALAASEQRFFKRIFGASIECSFEEINKKSARANERLIELLQVT